MYKNYINRILVLLIILTSVSCQEDTGQKTSTAIRLLDSVIYTETPLGNAGKPDTFRFINIGSNPLIIDKVNADCSCISATIAGGKYATNDTIYLITHWNYKNPGPFQHVITVEANIPGIFENFVLRGYHR